MVFWKKSEDVSGFQKVIEGKILAFRSVVVGEYNNLKNLRCCQYTEIYDEFHTKTERLNQLKQLLKKNRVSKNSLSGPACNPKNSHNKITPISEILENAIMLERDTSGKEQPLYFTALG